MFHVEHNEKYRPSNGTEGDCFRAAWCEHCAQYLDDETEEYCPILGATFALGIGDEGYPTDGREIMFKAKLALPKCDKCGHKWHARYRRNKPTKFFCPKCSRVHPRWTAKELEEVDLEAARLIEGIDWVKPPVAA